MIDTRTDVTFKDVNTARSKYLQRQSKITFPDEIHSRLKIKADIRGITIANLIRLYCVDGLYRDDLLEDQLKNPS